MVWACEMLEKRRLLSVVFSPGPLAAPTNRADLALGTLSNFVPIEPMIRVNPTDAANVVPSSHRGGRISTNGGASFGGGFSFSNPAGTNVFNGDTDMAYDATGRLYWVNMAGTGTAGISVSRINPSTGASFSSVNISNSSDDKPFIAADATATSPFANNVYVVWTRFSGTPEVFFARSSNQAVSFGSPQIMSNAASGGQGFVWPSDVGVAPNGGVYVAWHANGTFGSTSGVNGRVLVRRSTNGGVSFGAPIEVFAAGQADITANVQDSVGTIPGTQFWTQGSAQPCILPDPARPGNIYCVTADDPNNIFGNGDNGDIVFARSINDGANWTRSTISSGPSNSFQIYPTASIDKFGNIVVAWYDNRRGLTNGVGRFKLDIMATYSTDGGLTWAPEFMINDPSNPFDPDPGAVNRFPGPPPTTRIGEYFGIDLYGNTAHVAWNGNIFSGITPINQQVWYNNFAIAGSLTVNGDDSGLPTDDIISINQLAGSSDFIEVVVNGARQYAGLREGLSLISVNAGPGTDTINISSTGATIPIQIVPSGGDDTLNINSAGVGQANVVFNATQRLGAVSIGGGGVATLNPLNDQVVSVTSLNMTGTGVLNLNDGDMIIDYTGASPIAPIESLLAGGYNGGAWSGNGINSSTAAGSGNTALGFAESSEIFTSFPATFSGQPVDDTAVLLKYTFYGDANLTGDVTLSDFNRLATNFGLSPRRWVHADFNFDGSVLLSDFNRLATNFGHTGLPPTHGDFDYARVVNLEDFQDLDEDDLLEGQLLPREQVAVPGAWRGRSPSRVGTFFTLPGRVRPVFS